MFCKLIVVLVCLMGAALGDRSPSPVFISGTNSIEKPAFYTLFQEEFANVIKPIIQKTMFVAFLEPNLDNVDFSCSKPSDQKSCYSNLQTAPQTTYYANVQNPIEALRQESSKVMWVNVDATGNFDNVDCEPGSTVLIDLSTVGGDMPRNELLELHDGFMAKVTKKLSEECKITALYTRKPSPNEISKNRRRRDVDSATSGTVFHSGKDFLIFYTELATKEPSKEQGKPSVITPIKITEMSLSGKNDTAFTVNMNGGTDKMSFLISLSGGYYQMSNLVLNGEAFYVPSEVNAPTNFSYSCGNQTFSSKGADSNKIIIWNSLQMQAPFNDATPENFNFSDAWYCVGFFSSGILAGLFVVFILLGIMSVGICWMLDINTMDRFDDPKGKTITINVNE
ncbi:V-type proton ATPase subunit S1 [Eupeodes corollae]|uniref:V-type proton ATPase subunit S1 n=1 Tax=Eupeodes corollae TaxID=290404 RepID=UPI00248F56CC|nr:V-type proton ATPase subunit S1 [Eupeodes corollae]